MQKRKLKIINFLYLTDEKYNKIREYRNQEYIRKVSLNTKIISKEEHKNYKFFLEERKKYFAYLILNDEKDYGVITLKKDFDMTYTVGDYLIDGSSKYEGGGVVNRFCIMYLCNMLNIKYLNSEFKIDNTRGHRAGLISKVNSCIEKDGFFIEYSQVLDFNNKSVIESKARKLFDKIYEIEEIKL